MGVPGVLVNLMGCGQTLLVELVRGKIRLSSLLVPGASAVPAAPSELALMTLKCK